MLYDKGMDDKKKAAMPLVASHQLETAEEERERLKLRMTICDGGAGGGKENTPMNHVYGERFAVFRIPLCL
jgi:hypothetical protein